MKLIRARASGDGNLSAGSATKFRRVRRSLNAELLQGINRHEAICPSQNAERPKRSSEAITAGSDTDSHVGAYTIHHPII